MSDPCFGKHWLLSKAWILRTKDKSANVLHHYGVPSARLSDLIQYSVSLPSHSNTFEKIPENLFALYLAEYFAYAEVNLVVIDNM